MTADRPDKPPLWVAWWPKDALDGMQALSPLEELAYRRILDLIFVTGDDLRDDDRALAWMTKTGRAWPRIKAALIAARKIEVIEGRITNERARAACIESASFRAQKVEAANAGWRKRKGLIPQETTDAGASANAPAAAYAGAMSNQQSAITEKKDTPHTPQRGVVEAPAPRKVEAPVQPDPFDVFWLAYPRKVGKDDARKKHALALQRGVKPEEILAGLKRTRFDTREGGRFIPHPATWLNQGRWQDQGLDPAVVPEGDDEPVRLSNGLPV